MSYDLSEASLCWRRSVAVASTIDISLRPFLHSMHQDIGLNLLMGGIEARFEAGTV